MRGGPEGSWPAALARSRVGQFGQHIEVNPATRRVVAIQSYWPVAFSDPVIAHNDAVVAALIDALR